MFFAFTSRVLYTIYFTPASSSSRTGIIPPASPWLQTSLFQTNKSIWFGNVAVAFVLHGISCSIVCQRNACREKMKQKAKNNNRFWKEYSSEGKDSWMHEFSFCNFRTNKRRALSSWYITCSVSTGCVATFQYQKYGILVFWVKKSSFNGSFFCNQTKQDEN